MQSKMKRVFLLTMVCMLILTTFVGCGNPKTGTTYKDTNGDGIIVLTSPTTFSAKWVEFEGVGICTAFNGKGDFTYSGKTIRFHFTKSTPRIDYSDYLTAKVNADGSFTTCGHTYKKQ